MDKKLGKFLKSSRSKNQRSLIIILGEKALFKIPELYSLVVRGKNYSTIWFSSSSEDLSKIGWSAKKIGSGHGDNNTSSPQVIHVSDSNIQNAPLQSYHFAVIQDTEILTPSSIANIVQSIPGKGALIFIFSKITDVKKFIPPKTCDFTMSRFMKRFFASFTSCSNSIILNDKLDVLLFPKRDLFKTLHGDVDNQVPEQMQIDFPQNDGDASELLNHLINICSTEDQSRFLLECLDVLKRRSLRSIISASSAKGRGKSAVLGLAIAGAIVLKYSNIFISSLNCDNVKIIFKYLLAGLDAMQYKEDVDYDLIQSINPKLNNALLGLNIFRDHPQAVRFILPGDVEKKLEQAELVVIDEAAAIPLPLLKKLLGSYIVLMASTTDGCGGSGKYLYKDMISGSCKTAHDVLPTSETNKWKEVVLKQPTSYSVSDEIECWINQALCLECSINTKLSYGCPDPEICSLYFVCQETLFSYEDFAEKFLQQLMSLFFCSKRKLSPDILLKIADDDNYHIFCLLPPFDSKKGSYEILCAILVHTEKHIPTNIVYSGTNQLGKLEECFNDWTSPSNGELEDFLAVQGIHIVDIVTHPNYRRMGYGSRALRVLQNFYEGKCVSLDDVPYAYSCKTKKSTKNNSQDSLPLLLQLTEVEPESVNYILVSYYLTPDLLRFWKRNKFVPAYISSQKNDAQEHLCIMLKSVGNNFSAYMTESLRVFSEYYFILLSSDLKYFPCHLALELLECKFSKQLPKEGLTKEDIDTYIRPRGMKALEKYCQNLDDRHRIMPYIPILAKLFFKHRFVGTKMGISEQVVLLAFGIQHKTKDDISEDLISGDLNLSPSQIYTMFNRAIRNLTSYLNNIIEKTVEKTIAVRDINMMPVAQALDDELEEAAQKIKQQQLEDLKKLKEMDFSEFAIKGSEDDWEKVLHCGRKTLVSIKSLKKAPEDADLAPQEKKKFFKNKNTNRKRKK